MFYKQAKDNFQPHQKRVINRLSAKDAPHGLIAYHSLGSGKTYTALGAMDKLLANDADAKGLFVVPASLVTNVTKEVDKQSLSFANKDLKVKVTIG